MIVAQRLRSSSRHFAGALGELVVVVDHGRGLDAEAPAGQAQAQREVDVLLVHEERLGEAAGALPLGARDGEAGAGHERHLSRASLGAVWPAQAMPVKCTTPPLVFTARPSSAVTRPCHALHSPRGARIASRKPGAGRRVRVQEQQELAARQHAPRRSRRPRTRRCDRSRRSPPAARAPEPRPACRRTTRCRRLPARPRAVSCAHSGGSATDAAARLLWVTTTIDSMGATARIGGARMLASAPPGDLRTLALQCLQARTTRQAGSG